VTSTACGSCTAPVGDGARLCAGCTRDLAAQLLLAASIATDLDDAIARLLKRGSGSKSASTEPPLPIDLVASDIAEQLRIWLLRMVADQVTSVAQWPSGDIRSMSRWLLTRLADIRQAHEAPAEFAELRHRVTAAMAVIDRLPERAPAGKCEQCGAQLLAELGADEVTCACGLRLDGLREQRARRAAAADVLGTPAEISGALNRIGIHVPRGTITSWASRGRLTARPNGLFALSDVLALHAQSKTRR
jgi:hypothetical protein